MNQTKEKNLRRNRRHKRIRSRIVGTSMRPRLSIFKSMSAVYAQVIDDEKGATLASADSRVSKAKTPKGRAKDTGIMIAKAAKEKKVKEVVFDRGGFVYKGKIQAVADGAREGGLKF